MVNKDILFEILASKVKEAIVVTDAAQKTIWVNRAFTKITGYVLDDLLGKRPGDVLQGKDTADRDKAKLAKAIEKLRSITVDIVNYTKSGVPYINEVSLTPLLNDDGEAEYFIAVQRDVTELRSLVSENIDFRAYQRALDEQAIVSVADVKGDITYVNEKFCEISEYSSDELVGRNHRIVNSGYHDYTFFEEMWKDISNGFTWHAEVCNKSKSGSLYWVDTSIVPVKGADGKIIRYVSIRYDITQKKQIQDELALISNRDKLTGLLNRDGLSKELSRQQRTIDGESRLPDCVILNIGLDYFKELNEQYSYGIGDIALRKFARRLSKVFAENAILGRLGGDEFLVISFELSAYPADKLQTRLNRLFSVLKKSLLINNISVAPRFSMGVARCPNDGNDTQLLLTNADIALQEAKIKGRDQWCFFNPLTRARLEHKKYIRAILEDALAEKMFEIALQPMCYVHNCEHYGFEVLVRLKYLDKWISPMDFIPLAEEFGMINKIGDIVINEALLAIQNMKAQGLSPGKVAINVSPVQFQQADFVKNILKSCEQFEISTKDLIIEITETALISDDADMVNKALQHLRANHVTIALDDFGTGFSSLSHLRQFSVNEIKIDKSFIQNLQSDPEDHTLVDALITLGKKLGLTVVAEGVETQEQQASLKALNCCLMQGYWHSKPLSPEAAIEYLQGKDSPKQNAKCAPC